MTGYAHLLFALINKLRRVPMMHPTPAVSLVAVPQLKLCTHIAFAALLSSMPLFDSVWLLLSGALPCGASTACSAYYDPSHQGWETPTGATAPKSCVHGQRA